MAAASSVWLVILATLTAAFLLLVTATTGQLHEAAAAESGRPISLPASASAAASGHSSRRRGLFEVYRSFVSACNAYRPRVAQQTGGNCQIAPNCLDILCNTWKDYLVSMTVDVCDSVVTVAVPGNYTDIPVDGGGATTTILPGGCCSPVLARL